MVTKIAETQNAQASARVSPRSRYFSSALSSANVVPGMKCLGRMMNTTPIKEITEHAICIDSIGSPSTILARKIVMSGPVNSKTVKREGKNHGKECAAAEISNRSFPSFLGAFFL